MKHLTQFRTLFCSNPVGSTLAICIGFLLSQGCSQSPENRPSPLRSDSTVVGSNYLQIEYSSPGVKNRKIFGSGGDYLVSFNEMWRTGANEATVFSTEEAIMIDSIELPKGKYALFTIPGEESWEIILNTEWDQWGSYQHKKSLDALRLSVKPQTFEEVQERMKLYFENDSLKFRWDRTGWAIPISSI